MSYTLPPHSARSPSGLVYYTADQMQAAFAAGAASRDAELNQAERDYSAKCSELEIVHAECDALRDEIQRQYACINSHAEITFKAEDERDLLRVEVEALRKELREGDDLRNRLAGILTRSVNLIRGEPEPLCLHSWHDLPELIDALRADAALLDWLTAKGVEYGGGWHARENVANRGYRLHQGRVGGFETPRVAISAAIAAEGKTP